ncbi:glycine cleavage system H protein [Geothrix limicola]|uniref:Glycine cleavage system H protein n=1 Tax=Geothrix limicola TaxID=2927978 RepID=A0ABQ5QCF9_9BACT|nr:glycine cleavage system protein GcvH [Geothrix limicola]GLH72332.1 glycine cleavage system H protein [Geothrix limicola]
MFPADLKYTKDHEWLKPAGDGTALVGITHYAQDALGDVVFVDLPEAGATFAEGEEFGTVESVKTVSELNMPAAGEIVEVNAVLADHPEAVNEDPYGKGWMVKVKLAGDLSGLLDAKAYEALVGAESH